jgi:hypothetical protein
MDIGSSFPGGKMTGAWSWSLTSIWCWGKEWWSYTSTTAVSIHGVILN